MTVKYFLASFLICTFAYAEAPALYSAMNLGTLEMWSDWQASSDPDSEQTCQDVTHAYNLINRPRGYWGQLINPDPIRTAFRRTEGSVQQRFFCHLRVFKILND
jgi:hypothetical protein